MATPDQQLYIEILSPLKSLYKGYVSAVSSQNNKGKFDILAEHGPFISIIKEFVMITELNNQKKEFKLDTAVLKCADNQVKIFIGYN